MIPQKLQPRRRFGAVGLTASCDLIYGRVYNIGFHLLRGSDRTSYVLDPGRYLIETWIRAGTDEYGLRDWGQLQIGRPGEWILTSRDGLVIATPEWIVDRRPGRSGPVFRRGIKSVVNV